MKAAKTAIRFLAVVVGLIIVGNLAASYLNGHDAREKAKREWETHSAQAQAIDACHKGAREQLKAPRTAKFPSQSQVDVRKVLQTATIRKPTIPEGSRVIESYVDAQNSFGALIRSNESCIVSPTNTILALDVTTR